jgi:hypothetical protein
MSITTQAHNQSKPTAAAGCKPAPAGALVAAVCALVSFQAPSVGRTANATGKVTYHPPDEG